jgi:hypothetical protein
MGGSGRSIYLPKLGLCLDLLRAKDEGDGLWHLSIPLGLIPRRRVGVAQSEDCGGSRAKSPKRGIPKV